MLIKLPLITNNLRVFYTNILQIKSNDFRHLGSEKEHKNTEKKETVNFFYRFFH